MTNRHLLARITALERQLAERPPGWDEVRDAEDRQLARLHLKMLLDFGMEESIFTVADAEALEEDTHEQELKDAELIARWERHLGVEDADFGVREIRATLLAFGDTLRT